eukprot:364357-Chlamydomonas_euryale.AAC.5
MRPQKRTAQCLAAAGSEPAEAPGGSKGHVATPWAGRKGHAETHRIGRKCCIGNLCGWHKRSHRAPPRPLTRLDNHNRQKIADSRLSPGQQEHSLWTSSSNKFGSNRRFYPSCRTVLKSWLQAGSRHHNLRCKPCHTFELPACHRLELPLAPRLEPPAAFATAMLAHAHL